MNQTKKNVLICDTQPVAVEGMKWLLESTDDLRFGGSVQSMRSLSNAMLAPAAASEQEQATRLVRCVHGALSPRSQHC